MLIVEQNTAVALSVSSRCYVLVGGRVVLAGDASEVGNRHELVSRFLGQADLDEPGGVTAHPDSPRLEGTVS